MAYANIAVPTRAILTAPAPVPQALAGLSDAQLADISWCAARTGLPKDTGYWPIVLDPPPSFDPSTQKLGPGAFTVDARASVVHQAQVVVPLTPAEVAAIKLAFRLKPMSPLDMQGRFTQNELVAIEIVAGGVATALDPSPAIVRVVKGSLNAASEVILADPRTVAGVQAFVTLGILTQVRADAILGL